MPPHNIYVEAIPRAYRATPIKSLEVKDGVIPLGIFMDSIQAGFRVRHEESEVAEAMSEAIEKEELWIGVAEGEGTRRKGRRAREKNQ